MPEPERVMTKPERIEAGLRCCAGTNVLKCDGCWYHGLRNCREQLIKDTQQYIENIKRVAARIEQNVLQLQAALPKWISVEERLPEESGSYLVCTRRSDAFTAHYYLNANEWKSHFAGSAGKHITHWMPLPKPPKED